MGKFLTQMPQMDEIINLLNDLIQTGFDKKDLIKHIKENL